MHDLSAKGLRVINQLAAENGVSAEAALVLLRALSDGNCSQAQFQHPELGGMGQWSQGGMTMIGDMFNHGLKFRVDRLCNGLASLLLNPSPEYFEPRRHTGGENVSLFAEGSSSCGQWWPDGLGAPASVGAQNNLRYAYFPEQRRLSILQNGRLATYDTGEHKISGFSQQQSDDQSLTFTSQIGLVRVGDLRVVSPRADQTDLTSPPAGESSEDAFRLSLPSSKPPDKAHSAGSRLSGDEIFSAIERLGDLRQKDILTEEEFTAKKRELLNRL